MVQVAQQPDVIEAAISRKNKRVLVLEKQQLIYKLENENHALKAKNEALEKEVQQLKSKFDIFEHWQDQPEMQLSITIPQTTMLLRYPIALKNLLNSLQERTLRHPQVRKSDLVRYSKEGGDPLIYKSLALHSNTPCMPRKASLPCGLRYLYHLNGIFLYCFLTRAAAG